MRIPPEVLAEKNYEGTRLIEVTDEAVLKLRAVLIENQKEANPFIVEMERLTPSLDGFYAKLRPIEEERKKIKDEMEPVHQEFKEWMEKADKVNQKAQLIKDKMVPMINKLVAPELGEFELAKELVEKDGKLYVEVVDEIEEKVKAVRASKK